MQLVSLNTARVEAFVATNGEAVTSAIRKRARDGAVAVGPLGLAGDEQADPSVHGGLAKAVYAYPQAHYAFWQTVRGQAKVPGALQPGGSSRPIDSSERLRVLAQTKYAEVSAALMRTTGALTSGEAVTLGSTTTLPWPSRPAARSMRSIATSLPPGVKTMSSSAPRRMLRAFTWPVRVRLLASAS